MAKKHKTNKKLNTRISFTDALFIDRKIRGCEAQLIKIEKKLCYLKCKTGLMKLIVMKEIEQLTRSQRDYEKLLKTLEAEKAKQMDRSLIRNDAIEDIKESFSRFASNTNITKDKKSIQEEVSDFDIYQDPNWLPVN